MALTTSPRGTADIFGSNLETWLKLEGYIRDICRTYGYQELRTPIFEHTELFQRGIGETTDIVEKEMYTFTDRGGRSITLRPEGTAPVVRAFLEHNMGQGPLPVKLFYLGPMFRYRAASRALPPVSSVRFRGLGSGSAPGCGDHLAPSGSSTKPVG